MLVKIYKQHSSDFINKCDIDIATLFPHFLIEVISCMHNGKANLKIITKNKFLISRKTEDTLA